MRVQAERLRGVVALTVLILLVAGLPAVLWSLGQALIPTPAPGWLDPFTVLTQPDDGSLLLGALLLSAWIAWLFFALSVAIELVAVFRRIPTPRLAGLGWLQQSSAALVATAALLVTSGATSLAGPVARPVPAALVIDRDAQAVVRPIGMQTASVPLTDKVDDHPTVEVRRHDTLWSLAEKHLGSGERFKEILSLNLGRPQSDGRALSESHWVFPGWILRLPRDAVISTTASMPGETYTVKPGDTLSEIAVDELGERSGYGAIFDLNKGHPQPNGGRLSDPDKIEPGWVLDVPRHIQPGPVRRRPPPVTARSVIRVPHPAEPDAAIETPIPSPPASSASRPEAAPSGNAATAGAEQAIGIAAGVSMMAATGLIWELRRRRRRQQRSRRLGERIAMPEPAVATAEAQITALESPVTVETVRHALRALLASCREEARQLPDVLLVRVSPASVSLELREDDLAAVAPFVASTPRTWRLAAGSVPEVEGPDPYPALLTLGVDGDDIVLLNLESVGQLSFKGSADDTAAVIRAAALDLAVGPLSGSATLTFAGCFGDMAGALEPTRARTVDDATQAAVELQARREATEAILASAGASDVLVARSQQVALDVTVPEIVISAEALTNQPGAWSGSCVVAAGPASSEGGHVVTVLGAEQAILEPTGVRLRPQWMSAEAYATVLSMLTTAVAESPAVEEIQAEPAACVAASLPSVPPATLDLRDDALQPPRVLVLGRVEVERANDSAVAHRRRRASELVAYLALHPGASASEIDEALWPGKRVDKSTRNPFISRARQWLGRNPDGQPYLPLVADEGSYSLRPEVSCDWHDFVRFAKLGLASGQDGETPLAAALELVRGRPFLGIDPATYTWAEPDVQEMISAIVDVAHVLSTLRCEGGDHRGAQEAASKGLMAEPCSELLYRDSLAAASAAGDRDRVEFLADRLRRELQLLDPDDSLDEATSEALVSSRV